MRIRLSVNQLHIDPHLIGRFLHAAFKNVRDTKLLCDLGEFARFALIALRGSARDYFQIRDLSQPRQDLLLDTLSEVGVVSVGAEIFKWQHGDAFVGR